MGVGGQGHAPLLHHRERSGTHCNGSWVGARAGLDWRGILTPGFDRRTVHPVASRYTV
jgi:hypothetical protein